MQRVQRGRGDLHPMLQVQWRRPCAPAQEDLPTRATWRGQWQQAARAWRGHAGRRGGPPGDLYVFVNVREDPDLRRDGTTIHSDVEVSYIDAILGTTQKIKTVDGLVDLKIPPGTQPGTTLLMRKRGVPRLGQPAGDRGDQRVHVRVAIPQKLSGEEKKLIENLRDLQKQGATKSGWFS